MRAPHRSLALGLVLAGLVAASTALGREPAEDEEERAAETDEADEQDEERKAEPADAAEGDEKGADETAAAEAKPKADEAAAKAAVGDAGEDAAGQEPAEAPAPFVELHGYIEPGFRLRYWPAALPIDRMTYGFFGDAGLTVEAHPFEMWSGKLQVVFSSTAFEAVTHAEIFDLGGDGSVDGLLVSKESLPGVIIEEATVSFDPIQYFGARVGAMRIPFTLQQQSANQNLTFPERSLTNNVFTTGADFGLLLYSNVGDGHFRPSVGLYNGDSLGLLLENVAAKGPVLAFRADVNPFGGFPSDEGDANRGPFRLGGGFGLLYRPATLYDTRTGYDVTTMDDLRLSASLRLAWAGLYFAAEYIRRQTTDEFSSRPHIADGAYAQLSYFGQIEKIAIEPIARVGFVAWDESFDPRLKGTLEGGLNFYPRVEPDQPDWIKITGQYQGTRRFTQDEDIHGFSISARIKF